MKRLVIFDFDGVLVQTEYIKIMQFVQIMQTCGVNCDRKELTSLVGMTHDDFILHLDHLYSSNACYQHHRHEIISQKANFDYENIMTPYTIELLKELKNRGIKTAIASNSSTTRLNTALTACQISQYIDALVSGTEEGKKKPDPYIYKKTMEEFAISAKETLIVEDSSLGIEAAVQSGAFVAAFDDHNMNIDQSKSHIQISNLLDILHYLD